jgi:hypothetical protein
VIAKTQHFLAVLKGPNADQDAKVQALKFVNHFVGDWAAKLAKKASPPLRFWRKCR